MRLEVSPIKTGALVVLGSLSLLCGTLEAGHVAPPNPYKGPALLHSSHDRWKATATEEACTVDPTKELFITDLSVVEDCFRTTWGGACTGTRAPASRGAWTFGKAMEGVFGTTDPQQLSKHVRRWLKLWMEDQVVNGQTVEARTAMQNLILKPWEKASGGGRLDMRKAPFRLLAMVLRMDVGNPIFLPQIQSAGEFRLVYGVLDERGQPAPFTLILEFQMSASNCQDILGYVRDFHALSAYEFGPQYNAALQALTDRFITRNAAPGNLNKSALLALRTNEAFLGSPWEMRSFRLEVVADEDDDDAGNRHQGGGSHVELVHQVNELTPATSYQNTQALADFINLNAQNLLDGNLAWPTTFRGQPFLAGSVQNNLDLGWDGPPPACSSLQEPSQLLRLQFSFFTCQGCHGSDTGTRFVHVTPRRAGQASSLSPFMTGTQVTDACGLTFAPNDLERRRDFQCFLLTLRCEE